ncbi:hypothetical protein C8T65DRAFT_257217 [Cerioporus squamosus]|nr:hypothetical protein C8T65DRAFT_257217 [Cerioporus squamosus]
MKTSLSRLSSVTVVVRALGSSRAAVSLWEDPEIIGEFAVLDSPSYHYGCTLHTVLRGICTQTHVQKRPRRRVARRAYPRTSHQSGLSKSSPGSIRPRVSERVQRLIRGRKPSLLPCSQNVLPAQRNRDRANKQTNAICAQDGCSSSRERCTWLIGLQRPWTKDGHGWLRE